MTGINANLTGEILGSFQWRRCGKLVRDFVYYKVGCGSLQGNFNLRARFAINKEENPRHPWKALKA